MSTLRLIANGPRASPSFLGRSRLESLLPADLPLRDTVVSALLSLRIPNRTLIAYGAGRLVSLASHCPWLASGLAPNDSYTLLTSLHVLAGPISSSSSIDHASLSEHFSTLVPKRPDPLGQAERLRSLFVLAGYLSAQDASLLRVPEQKLAQLGSRIRRIDGRAGGAPSAEQLESAARSGSLGEISNSVERDLAGEQSQFAKDWQTFWIGWIAKVEQIPFIDQVEGEPKRASPVRLPGNEGQEEPDELPPASRPAPTPRGKAAPSSKFTAAFADQSLRWGNHYLLKEHVAVASDTEVGLLVADARRMLAAHPRSSLLLGPCLALLATATGRTDESLSDTFIFPTEPSDQGRHLRLNLKLGTLNAPVIEPPEIFVPEEERHHLYQQTKRSIDLPLPSLLVRLLQELLQAHPAGRVADWLKGQAPPAQIQAKYLRSVPGLSRSLCIPSRFRNWLSCQLQSMGSDVVNTMITCGDLFGRPSSPLYYCSPLQSEIEALYVRSVWATFGEAPPENSVAASTQRVGPAWIARDDLVRAGVSEISKRLNVNPDRANQTLERVASYHNAFTDYLARYVAFIASNRPNGSLYKLTRWAFDLRRCFAVLEDKKSDPEHLTRIAAITPKLASTVKHYLQHLGALKALPWCPPQLLEQIERVLAGDAPLLQYIDLPSGGAARGEFE